ncbi:MAG: hypothetical protein ACXAAO_03470 [Candidatus Thorarchaeota archaeon]|jgi:hypothetical protein
MAEHSDDDTMDDEGIVVDTSLDILREGAKKVLYEFNETIIDMDGEPRVNEGDIQSGDTVLFIENIPNCPARIVAVKIIRGFWYVNATSDTPKGGYPSGRDAMKAAEMDDQNLKILEKFLIEKEGRDCVKDVDDWRPDLKGEAVDVLGILNNATRKWNK